MGCSFVQTFKIVSVTLAERGDPRRTRESCVKAILPQPTLASPLCRPSKASHTNMAAMSVTWTASHRT